MVSRAMSSQLVYVVPHRTDIVDAVNSQRPGSHERHDSCRGGLTASTRDSMYPWVSSR